MGPMGLMGLMWLTHRSYESHKSHLSAEPYVFAHTPIRSSNRREKWPLINVSLATGAASRQWLVS